MPLLKDTTNVSINNTVDEIRRCQTTTAQYAAYLNRRLLMDELIKHALERDRTIDITTRGRKTGQLHRTELWFDYIDGHVYITGAPGRRDWYANLLAQPEFTFHLLWVCPRLVSTDLDVVWGTSLKRADLENVNSPLTSAALLRQSSSRFLGSYPL
jgi:hypothetical protein